MEVCVFIRMAKSMMSATSSPDRTIPVMLRAAKEEMPALPVLSDLPPFSAHGSYDVLVLLGF